MGSLLTLLVLLACPAMMYLCMRGMRGMAKRTPPNASMPEISIQNAALNSSPENAAKSSELLARLTALEDGQEHLFKELDSLRTAMEQNFTEIKAPQLAASDGNALQEQRELLLELRHEN